MATFTLPTDIPTQTPDQSDEEFAAQMRAMGFRQSVRWVPDMSNPAVVEEYKRQFVELADHQRRHPDELIEITEDDLAGWE